MKIKVYVLSRTEEVRDSDEGRRILEGTYATHEEAEAERQKLIKMFAHRPSLLIDTEIEEFEVEVPLFVVARMDADCRELSVSLHTERDKAVGELKANASDDARDGSLVERCEVDGDEKLTTAISEATDGVKPEFLSGNYIDHELYEY